MSEHSAYVEPGSQLAELPLGAFAVRPDGSLSAREAGNAPALRFAWRGRPCSATLGPSALELSAEAGMVPSTAEAPAAREATFGLLSMLPSDLPRGWELRLSPDHSVRFGATASIEGPATVATLVAAMVRFVLALDPYLARLGDAVGPVGAPGSPSSCPG